MDFQAVASGAMMYVMVSAVIVFVFLLALLFSVKAWKRGRALGFSTDQLMDVIKSSLTTTIAPSIAIIIGLFALAPIFGVPWPWLRLSVIGSVTYELMAANMAASAIGAELSNLSAAGLESFVLIMYVMTAGISASLVVLLFFGKKIQGSMMNLGAMQNSFGVVALECFMVGLLSTFLPIFLTSDIVSALTFVTGLALTLLQGVFIRKFGLAWLKDFVLAFSLILGMASSVFWTSIFT